MNNVNENNFNETCKGYIIRACKILDMNKNDMERLLNGLRWSFDEMTFEDARKEYKKYLDGKIVF